MNALIESFASKLFEIVIGAIIRRVVPRVLAAVPHRASPHCPNCNGFGVARWAPGPVQLVHVLSLLVFVLTFTSSMFGAVFAVAMVIPVVVHHGAADLGRWALAVLGLAITVGVMFAAAAGMAWYQSYPPKWCGRCHARWPFKTREAHLPRQLMLFGCRCGQQLRLPVSAAGARIRCPSCGDERTAPTRAGRGKP